VNFTTAVVFLFSYFPVQVRSSVH